MHAMHLVHPACVWSSLLLLGAPAPAPPVHKVAEEERIESGAARESMSAAGISVAERVRGDQDSESSVVGGVMQLHMPAIRKLLYHSSVDVRHAALALLSAMMRQASALNTPCCVGAPVHLRVRYAAAACTRC